jgi:hypothetical protein
MGRGVKARFTLPAALAAVAVSLLAPAASGAATLTVNTTDEFSATDCSLNEAIFSANNNFDFSAPCGATRSGTYGDDVIDITATGTINLSSSLATITSNIDINGPGADQLDIHRNTGGDYRVVTLSNASNSSISGVTISNGHSSTFSLSGVGLTNLGTVLLENVVVRDNVVDAEEGVLNPSPDGGGIVNAGTMTIRDSTVTNNTVSSTQTAASGQVSADTQGGGVFSTGTLTVERSTVTGNSSIAEVKSDDPSADALAVGGGIATQGGTLSITNSTVSGNQTLAVAEGGGFTTTGGGGISNVAADLTLAGTTIASNTAEFSAAVSAQGTETITDSILANDGTDPNCGGPIDTDGGFNISFPTPCEGLDAALVDPQLLPLGDYGGPTATVALDATSPALDAGIAAGNATDQRGVTRPNDIASIFNAPGGDGSDIGALEAEDDDNDGLVNEADECPSLQGDHEPSGCPSVARELTLKYKKGKRRFSGKVRAPDALNIPQCVEARTVSVWRKRQGPDKKIGDRLSGAGGAYELKKRARKGKYYSSVGPELLPDIAFCQKAKSPTIKVR